jgi:hypothetical protein
MARVWTCRRITAGQRCGHQNPGRKRKCEACGLPRPALSRPAHMAALDLPYEHYVEINGGEFCGICGAEPKDGRRLNRDHLHENEGDPARAALLVLQQGPPEPHRVALAARRRRLRGEGRGGENPAA